MALTEPGHTGQTYTITGPEAVTHAEIADAIGAATGRQVTFTDAPAEMFAAVLRDVLPEWQVAGLLEDYAHYSRGEAAAVLPTVTAVTGQPPRTLAQFAKEYEAAFTPA